MKIAIFGGTHGNEPVGIEAINKLNELSPKSAHNEYKTFLGNPEAYKQQKRFVDCDLNRCFGVNGNSHGHEAKRSKELALEIEGKYDFIMDLHTTTSNMGITLLLTQTDTKTRQIAAYLQKKHPELILIETIKTDDECCYVCNMAPSGLIVEVGAVANNVIRFDLFKKVYDMCVDVINYDSKELDLSTITYYKSYEDIKIPDGFYIHPSLEGNDFCKIMPGDPLFINFNGEVIKHTGKKVIYPMFINEAAYQNDRLAMTLSNKMIGFN